MNDETRAQVAEALGSILIKTAAREPEPKRRWTYAEKRARDVSNLTPFQKEQRRRAANIGRTAPAKTGAPRMTLEEMRQWAAEQKQRAALQRDRFARMSDAEKLAEFRKHTNAVHEMRRKWRQREADAEMLQRHRDAELIHLQAEKAESERRHAAIDYAGRVYATIMARRAVGIWN